VTKPKSERWLEENVGALESYNVYLERNGLPLEEFKFRAAIEMENILRAPEAETVEGTPPNERPRGRSGHRAV
jgi:hypothetical protein